MPMAALKRRPFSDLLNEFQDASNGFFNDSWLTITSTIPKVNVAEDNKNYILTLAVPGMAKKDFKIDVDGNIMTISAEKEEAKEEKENNYISKEYNYSSFSRSFILPDDVKQDKLDAGYTDGILKINLPKKDESLKLHKTIAIK